jgi:hypothetical protein
MTMPNQTAYRLPHLGRRRILALEAVLLFVISHFLPALSEGSGFDCFKVCWDSLWGHDADIFSGGWFYYGGFAISNILFLGLVAALFATEKFRKLRSAVSIVFFLHVLSWLALNIFQQSFQIGEIKIGYYVWLLAYGLLVAAHLWKESDSLQSIPLVRPAV